VTVCGAEVVFVQMTVVPTLTVSVAGLKANDPLLSVVIVTAEPLLLVGVLVGVETVVGALVAAVVGTVVGVVPPVPVALPPQAARSASTASIVKLNQKERTSLRVTRVRQNVCIFFLFYNLNGYPGIAADVVSSREPCISADTL